MNTLKRNIESSIQIKHDFLRQENIDLVDMISSLIIKKIKEGSAIIFCGNGGSASDALHLSAELSGRYYKNRSALRSFALGTNLATITAISNDFGFEYSFSRELESLGKSGDVVIALSTSGNSENVVNCISKAKQMNITTIGFTGKSGGNMQQLCDYVINVPSEDVPRIQEIHMLVGHTICEIIEREIFKL